MQRARLTLIALLGLGVTACADEASLLAPGAAGAPAAARHADVDDPVDDVTDALDRLVPALADEDGAASLAPLLRRLRADVRAHDTAAARRDAALALAAVEQIERADGAAAHAEAGALRLVLEARR